MKGSEFVKFARSLAPFGDAGSLVKKIKKLGKANDLEVWIDRKRGKGSHTKSD